MASNQLLPSTLNASSDPRAFDYLRLHDVPGSSGSDSTVQSKDSKKRGFFKKLFHKVSSNKLVKHSHDDAHAPLLPVGGFSMPYLAPPQFPSSERSRTAADSVESIQDVAFTVHVASGRPRNTVLKVHAYEDDVQPLAHEDCVRFSHPVVREVRPVTPMSVTGSHVDLAETLTADEPSPSASTESLDDTNNLQPKKIWRNSDLFKTPEGELVSYRDFKAKLDGHYPNRSSKTFIAAPISKHPPSLSFIPSVGSFTIEDDPVFRTDSCTPEPLRVHKYRNTALNMLNGGAGVLAVIPRADMPESTVPVLSKSHPSALTPQQFPSALTPGQRPFSFPTTATGKQQYQPFNPDALSSAPTKKQSSHLAGPELKTQCRPKTPDFFDRAPQSRDLHARVESGIFSPTVQPSLPTPPSSNKSDKITRKPVHPTTQPSHSTGNLPLSKPLSPTPHSALKKNTSNIVPAPTKMNDNGYPMLERKSRPVSSMTMDRVMLDEMESERRELEGKIAKQQEKLRKKERARRGE